MGIVSERLKPTKKRCFKTSHRHGKRPPGLAKRSPGFKVANRSLKLTPAVWLNAMRKPARLASLATHHRPPVEQKR